MKIVGIVWELEGKPEHDIHHLCLLTEAPDAQFLLTCMTHDINLS